MKKDLSVLFFAIFGCLSGMSSLFLFALSEAEKGLDNIVLGLAPGLIFGITISVLLFFFFRRAVLFHVFFVILSAFAYYVSIEVFALSHKFFDNYSPAFLVAGLVGSLILVIALRFVYKLSPQSMMVMIAVGAIAALVGSSDSLALFPPWQTAVAVAIGYTISKIPKPLTS